MITTVHDAAGLRDAMLRATAGSTIILENGVYTLAAIGALRTGAHGTASAPITLRALNPRMSFIDSSDAEEAIRVVHSFWRLEDLAIRVTGRSTYGVKLEGDAQGARISRCLVVVGAESECAIKGAGNADGPCPDRCVVEDCELAMPAPTTYSMAEGVDAVACHGWQIRGNRVRGFRTAKNDAGFGLMLKGNAKNALIEKNVVVDCFIGVSLGGGGTGAEWVRDHDQSYETRNGVVQDNVISSCFDVAVYLYAANATRVFRNYVVDSYNSLGASGSSIDVRMPGSTADIRMNILDKKIRNRDGGQHVESGNLYLPPRIIGKTSFVPA